MPLVKMASRFEDDFIVLVSKLVSVKKKKLSLIFYRYSFGLVVFFRG